MPFLRDYPHLFAQLHPTKNRGIVPARLRAKSNRKLWWKCPAGPDHEWMAVSHNRARGQGCPFCANRRLSVTNSLATIPRLVRQWHPTKNGALTPRDVTVASRMRVWWTCPEEDDHVWDAPVFERARRGRGCPFCIGRRTSKTTALTAAAPAYAAEWHPTKNGALKASDVTISSGRIVWWKCSANPAHEWRAGVHLRTRAGQGCPYCSRRRITPESSFAARFPELVPEWHPTKNGALTPWQVAPSGQRAVWWKCPRGPDHEWSAVLNSRAAGTGCPFCANRRVSVTNSLATRFPKVASQWHPTKNGLLTPDAVAPKSHRRAWWRCVSGHTWDAVIAKRTHEQTGCPSCYLRGRRPVTRRKPKRYVHLARYEGARRKKG